jgi:hypothetical protein
VFYRIKEAGGGALFFCCLETQRFEIVEEAIE